jgi:hypothetical protein
VARTEATTLLWSFGEHPPTCICVVQVHILDDTKKGLGMALSVEVAEIVKHFKLLINLIIKVRSSSLWYPALVEHRNGRRHAVRAENVLVESVGTSYKARSAFPLQSLCFRKFQPFRVSSTARENLALAVLYSSDPALAGLKEKR